MRVEGLGHSDPAGGYVLPREDDNPARLDAVLLAKQLASGVEG